MTATSLTLLLTAVAGGLGSVVRAAVLDRSGPSGSAGRARGVAVVNLAGAVLLAAVQVAPAAGAVQVIVGVGFCGALTTFSTWVVEAAARAREAGWVRVAAFDLAGQLAVGVLLVALLLRLA